MRPLSPNFSTRASHNTTPLNERNNWWKFRAKWEYYSDIRVIQTKRTSTAIGYIPHSLSIDLMVCYDLRGKWMNNQIEILDQLNMYRLLRNLSFAIQVVYRALRVHFLIVDTCSIRYIRSVINKPRMRWKNVVCRGRHLICSLCISTERTVGGMGTRLKKGHSIDSQDWCLEM